MNNGGPTWKWVSGILLSIVLLTASYTLGAIDKRVITLESNYIEIIQRLTRIEALIKANEPTVRTNPSH